MKNFTLILLTLLLCGQVPQIFAAEQSVSALDQPKPVPVSALDQPNQQVEIWVDEKTGTFLPLDVEFADEKGSVVSLGGLIDKPTILLPIYFYCPNSCPTNLANLAMAINRMKMEIGDDYRAIALSFNHLETPENARTAKNNYLKLLYEGFPEEQWSFLTGSQENVAAVLDAIGFSFQPLDDGTFIHASTLVTVAPDGKLIKYVYGSFIPGDVELALAEAAQGVPARSIKRLLNYCFNYDPDTNKGLFEVVKFGVIALFAGIAVFIFFRFIWRKKPDDPDSLSSQHG
ncbi:MAG: SCO family protein [Desulfofustis sp.]|nr:SCO family protein [Desulfofustis sp.]